MWYCPQCGKGNDDEYSFCASCGKERSASVTPVDPDPAPGETYPQHKKTIPVWVFVAAAVVIALVLVLSLGVFSSADSLLKKADAAFEKEDFDSAYSYYTKYAEKAELSASETEELLEETKLALAGEAIDNEKWEDAEEYLEDIEGSEAEELIKACKLGLAGKAIEDEDWDEAKSLLEECDPEDAKDLIAQCNYHFAVEAMEKEDWETAAGLLEGIDYSDSEKLLEECESYLGPDSDFLDDLAEGVKAYMNANKSSISTRHSAIQSLQSKISVYSGQSFYDEGLGTLAQSIIENIDLQGTAGEMLLANEVYYRTYQMFIWQSMIDLCGYMEELNSGYAFLEGDSAFQKDFIDAKSTWQSQLDIINAFDKDFSEYRSKYSASSGTAARQMIKYKNNTGINLGSITFYFPLFDTNKEYIRTASYTIDVGLDELVKIYYDCNVYQEPYHDEDWYINF